MKRPLAPSDLNVPVSATALWGSLALVGLLVLTAGSASSVHAQGGGFTSDERAQLASGRLVSRPHSPSTGEPWLGGVSFQVIERSPSDVWRAVQDIAAYRYMLPGTELTRDDGAVEGARLVFVRQASMGLTATYWLRMRCERPTHSITFDLDTSRPHDVQQARGFLEIRPFPGQPRRTLVTWGVRAVLGGGALDGMFRDIVEPWLLRVPATMKQYLEGRASERYGPP